MSRFAGPMLVLAALAFFMPVAYALFLHRDEIFREQPIEPGSGYMIFFTSPS